MTTQAWGGNISLSHKGGGPALARRIPKELRICVLTLFGILSTVGVGVILRNVHALRSLVITGEAAFVVFTIYGLAFSLISGSSTVIRRRDTTILILAATIMWGIFVAEELALEMVRFLVFAALMTIGIRMGRGLSSTWPRGFRIALTTVLSGVLCGLGGLVYHGVGSAFGLTEYVIAGGIFAGLSWGLSLGLAVGLGISTGSEVVEWMAKEEG